MKLKNKPLVAFLFIIFVNSFAQENQKSKFATVELQWDKIEGAEAYELEVQNLKGIKLKDFKSKTGTFRIRMPVGKYQVRARVADDRGIYSDWSGVTDFIVPVDAPPIKNPPTTTVVPDPKSLMAHVDLKWQPVSQADFYKVQILNEKKEVISEKQTEKSNIIVDLPPGNYEYRVVGVNKQTQIESKPLEKNPKIIISKSKLPPPILDEIADKKLLKENTLKWQGHPLAHYVGDLEYMPFFGTNWISVKKFEEINDTNITLGKKWRPGKYRFQLWAEAKGFEKSDATYHEFVIKPNESDLPVVPY